MTSAQAMDSYTFLWLEWSIGSVLVCISGLLVLNYSDLLPNFIHRIVKYGKSAEAHETLQFLELPKRYFFHFYSLALVFYIFLTISAINIYFNTNLFGDPLKPSILRDLLDYFANYDILTRSSYHRIASGKSSPGDSLNQCNSNALAFTLLIECPQQFLRMFSHT